MIRTLLIVVLGMTLSGTCVFADYRIVAVDMKVGILSVEQNGAFKSLRFTGITDVTINGAKASVDQLRPGMRALLTLAGQQNVTRIVAQGNPGTVPSSGAGSAAKPAMPVLGALPSLGGPTQTRKITLKVTVDGQDTVKIRDGQLWFEHNGWGKPDSISVNGVPWQPQWNGNRTDSFTGFTPPLAPFDIATLRVRKSRGRGEIKTLEPPTQANQQMLSIYLNDSRNGADTYVVTITW